MPSVSEVTYRMRDTGRMNAEAAEELREVRAVLKTFNGPSCIHRASELDAAWGKVLSAMELLDAEADHLRQRLAAAVTSLRAAQKAAKAHRRNPLTRPISHARFALRTGSALGSVQVVLEELDPAEKAAREELHER